MRGQLRVQFPGAIYRIATRGDGRRTLFHDEGHYDRLTSGLEEEVTRSGWKVLSYLCRRGTGEPLIRISEQFGLSYPDSFSILIRRAKKRMFAST